MIAAFGASGAAVVGVITFWFFRKEHQLNGLVTAFKVLNDSEHREARENVYSVFDTYDKSKNIKVFTESDRIKKSTETVRSDFDQMGTLVRNGTIQKKGFLHAYGETAFRCWKALHDHIKDERTNRMFENYMENFEWLSNEAIRYWQKKGVNLVLIGKY